ncbi:MAG: hypothetical protein ACLTMP_04110 [Eggerthella lenta]
MSVSTTTFCVRFGSGALRERFSCATSPRGPASASPSSVNDSSERNPAAA